MGSPNLLARPRAIFTAWERNAKWTPLVNSIQMTKCCILFMRSTSEWLCVQPLQSSDRCCSSAPGWLCCSLPWCWGQWPGQHLHVAPGPPSHGVLQTAHFSGKIKREKSIQCFKYTESISLAKSTCVCFYYTYHDIQYPEIHLSIVLSSAKEGVAERSEEVRDTLLKQQQVFYCHFEAMESFIQHPHAYVNTAQSCAGVHCLHISLCHSGHTVTVGHAVFVRTRKNHFWRSLIIWLTAVQKVWKSICRSMKR